MTRFLITGLNGLIGWNLYRFGVQHYEVFGTYRKPHPRIRDTKVYQLEMHSEQAMGQILAEIKPDYFIHGWGMCDLDLCELQPEMAHGINVTGTQNILNACKRFKSIRKFIYISTDHVFNGERGNYLETDEPCPKDVFGSTKWQAEKLIKDSGLPYLIIRPGLVIGKSLQGRKGPQDFLLYRIRRNKPIHYFVDEWRTPVDAEELCRRVFELSLSDYQGVAHIAGTEIYSRFELARKIATAHSLPVYNILPRRREEDVWAHIRPEFLTLGSTLI